MKKEREKDRSLNDMGSSYHYLNIKGQYTTEK